MSAPLIGEMQHYLLRAKVQVDIDNAELKGESGLKLDLKINCDLKLIMDKLEKISWKK